ncbi:hypothetical protein EST38_g2214 [Candolleomyces aberdarensis]|uniref:TauD/TfdA-like domain-containing protein n=1 Tax=Candolleomyces aberdarensis TaxID=2316362 RepID=A0A4Q2DW67_9AGAR|nr:hypothetical protein EST38_g2214 [Candolleomyces aberdarensis]
MSPISPTARLSDPRVQPDISYHPDEARWQARTAQRLTENSNLPKTPLPAGFPAKVDSPLVWEGKDWKSESHTGLHTGLASSTTFPLPTLGPVLRALSEELHNGRGFFVLRTIPIESYTRSDIVLLYVGISSHIAPLRGLQDANGGVLSHIKDLSATFTPDKIGGPAYTTDKQVFHTDQGADIVSLFALETAKEGGVSRIGSSWRVYNELAETRPDLVRKLAEPWDVDEFGKTPQGYTSRPLLYHHDDRIIIQYARRYFTGFQGLPRSPGIPPITEAQAEALDALHFLASRFSLGLNFQKGDIQFINNLSIFHARDAFRDDEKQQRHLLRLWLRDPILGWEIPSELKPLWERTFDVEPEEQTFALNPVIRDAVKGRRVDAKN